MFRRAAVALFRRQIAEWRKLVIDSFDQTQAITDLVEACRARTWDPDLQEMVARIKTTAQTATRPEVVNPVADQIRDAFGDTEFCPEEVKK